MIKVAICDDDVKLTSQLENMIENYTRQIGIRIEVDIFFDGAELTKQIEEGTFDYDLIFLDIEMEEMDGMKTAYRIREKNQMVLLIFVTNYSNYALEAYAVHPFHFIVKPLEEEKVHSYFQQAYEVITAGHFYFDYKSFREYHRILVNDIMYFQSEKRRVYIYLKDGTVRQYYDKLDAIQEIFKDTKADFWRIHQSLLVNSRYILHKAFDHVELANGIKLSISEEKRKEINAHYIGNVVRQLED